MSRPRIVTTALVLVAAGCGGDGEARVSLGEPAVLSAPTGVGATPMLAVSPRGDRTIAWVSAPGGGVDGRLYVSTGGAAPTELRDPSGPIEPHGEAPPKLAYGPDGTLHALYAVVRLVPGRRFPHATLRLAASLDGGRTWDAPVSVAPDTAGASRNFHALHAADDGALYVAWLESRGGASATYLTRSDDGGATWLPPVRVDAAESCPCCRTAIATAPGGRVYLAWRTVMPGSVRDIVVARSDDRGATWQPPVRVHADDWVFEGCPHAGPSIQVDPSGRLHVAWWTGKEGAPGVWYASSADGGRTFGAATAIDTAAFSRPAHVQLALGAGGAVAVAWDDGTVDVPRVLVRLSRDGGRRFGPAVAASAEGAAATYPVLAVAGEAVTVGWMEQSTAAHEHEAHGAARMKDPKAAKGLAAVGAKRIVVRSGRAG